MAVKQGIRELGGQEWHISHRWNNVEKRMMWTARKWDIIHWGKEEWGGWQYWGDFATIGEWKQAVELVWKMDEAMRMALLCEEIGESGVAGMFLDLAVQSEEELAECATLIDG